MPQLNGNEFDSDAVSQPVANGHGQDDGHYSDNGHYSLSLTGFNPQVEAAFFYRLLAAGRITYKKACESIEMKSYQRDWLIAQGFAKRHQIELLYDLRQQTLSLFETLAREHGINGHGSYGDSILVRAEGIPLPVAAQP